MTDTIHPVRFGVQTPQQQTSWQDMLSLWREVDDLGFDTAWVFDHFLPIFSDPTGPCLEGWTALAALAMATQRVRLGVMVTGNTYRHPAVLAKMATTVDIISGGRLILGMGAGWFELEHTQYGIPFPQVRERLARLDEALEVIKRLWTGERATFTGRYYQLNAAVCNPRPVQQPHPPILVGAGGERVALGIVARHADMWNSFGTPDVFRHKIARLTEHCQRVGRDPATIERSVLLSALFPLREARQRVEEYIAAGVTHLIFSVPAPADRQPLRRFAQEILPVFRGREGSSRAGQ
ncbi:MAG: LLM class F420-dependent oxidoreductase [Thermodesulfobacteriota bacterium]|jgi:F420-dependent oxidoreductase-like protein